MKEYRCSTIAIFKYLLLLLLLKSDLTPLFNVCKTVQILSKSSLPMY